jgi:hypothetical protein
MSVNAKVQYEPNLRLGSIAVVVLIYPPVVLKRLASGKHD